MENLEVIKPNVFHQAHLLGLEKQRISTVASELRRQIAQVGGDWPNVPTAGVICNLNAVVDAWEGNQVQQIDDQVNEL